MNERISSLFSNSFAYSLGTVLSRFITFWLLPLTTSYLTPSDYGIIGNIALFSTLIVGLFQLGFNTSMAPVFYASKEEAPGVIWSGFIALVLNSIFLCFLFSLWLQPISSYLLNSPGHADLVFLGVLSTAFTACQFPFMFYLRAMQRARAVVFLCLIDVIVGNALMVALVMYWERGAAGVIEAQCLSLLIGLLLNALVVLPHLPFSFPWSRVKEMIKVGAPVIYGFLGFFILQSASRYMIQFYVNEGEAGLFFVGSNFARVIELGLWGFVSAWIPYFNGFVGREEEGKPRFSKVLSYFIFGVCLVSLCFFLLARPIVSLMVQPPFYPVWKIVGILSLAQASWGIYVISYTGIVMRKRTFLLSCIEIGAGIACIGWNALLIPLWGLEGAALATFLGFFTLIVISFAVNRKILQVPYEKERIAKAIVPFVAIAGYSFLPIESLGVYSGIGILLWCLYGTYLYKWVLTSEEQESIRIKLGWSKDPCVEFQQ